MNRILCLVILLSTVENIISYSFSSSLEGCLSSRSYSFSNYEVAKFSSCLRTNRPNTCRLSMQADLPPPGMAPNSNDIDWRGLEQVGDDWVRYGPKLEEANRNEEDLPEPRWYIVQCTPGLEDNVKMVLHSKINNSPWLQKTILEVLVPTTKVSKVKRLDM